jgi:hypothetical protein
MHSLNFEVEGVCATDVLHALAPQHNSLENLWLDCEILDFVGANSGYVHDPKPSFSKFNHLRNLRIHGGILCDFLYDEYYNPLREDFASLLPATLETLHIIDVIDMRIWINIQRFVLTEMANAPRLRKMFIESSISTSTT